MSNRNKNGKQPGNTPPTSNRVCGIKGISYYLLAIAFLAFGVGFLHVYHVSTLFENDRHFSHLSSLEREMAFYTEMGLYYSYYKSLVEAPTFVEGIIEIMYDNRTEYPSIINTLQRFNLYPEVVIAFIYRGYTYLTEKLNLTTKHCWHVDRGDGLVPVLSCEGLGDATYFYLEMVWMCSGLTMSVVFLFGHMLSGSIIGGVLSVLCFFYNHGESTRVQWSPALRESFGFPFCMLQMLTLTKCLQLDAHSSEHRSNFSLAQKVLLVWIPTWLFLLTWQFSQFVLTTQLNIVFLMYVLEIIKKSTFLPILYGYVFAVSHATFSLFVNEFLIFSFLTSTLISMMVMSLGLMPVFKRISFRIRVLIFSTLTPILIFVIKSLMSYISGSRDDLHIENILRAKFLGYQDFHTLLYTCSAEFDFISWDFVKNISNTLLLPSAFIALFMVCFTWVKSCYAKQGRVSIMLMLQALDPMLVYNILQMVGFGTMAALIMRLKLFFTPHLCLLVSLFASRKYFPWRSQELRLAFIFLLVSGMSVKGIQNLKEQREIVGEFSNYPLEQVIHWINTNTKPDAVFAGPMPLMANVLLSTRRPIVNHPHYEYADLRERTKKVYSIFSRRTPQEVYVTLSQLKVDYVIIGEIWCFQSRKKGCSTTDIWDVEEPENANRPSVCPVLFHGNPAPFVRVFSNEMYVILQVNSQSQYVELQSPMIFSQ